MCFKSKKAYSGIMASIAQVLLVVLVLPFLAIIIKAVSPDSIGAFITNTLDEIPVIKIFLSYFTAFEATESIGGFVLFEFIINTIASSIMSMYIVGLFVYIFKVLGELIGMRGISAIQTVIGIFLSSFCLSYLKDDFEKSILCSLVLIVIAFVLSVLLNKSPVLSFFWNAGVGIAMATITAGTVCAYCTVLVLIIKGYFPSLLSAVNVLIWALIPALICLLVEYLLFGKKT